MIFLKKIIGGLLVLLAFVGLLAFISITFEVNTTVAGKVTAIAIGAGPPWYQQVSQPSGISRELNVLAPSFWAGVFGLFIIVGNVIVDWKLKTRKEK